MLNELATLVEVENDFTMYAKTIKHWISGFGRKQNEGFTTTFWVTFGTKFCTKLTTTIFTLLLCLRQFDPNYTQELYLYWRNIVFRMDGLTRADTFYKLADKFKIVVQHLRTATSRTEQLAVMSVLRIYTEHVPVGQLHKLLEHDNAKIILSFAEFLVDPSILNQHEFLHRINGMGHFIESLKPKKIFCSKLNIDMLSLN
ncbi:hypothetical protein HA402_013352 [Bradysia odoriphaga]|nr:hypothetical protein HA402_013352 [Bradysia odoriphaga]